jgi:thiamine-monophosphate kinase
MMDMSDGLATDLAHICQASGLGARITMPPFSPALQRAAAVLADWDPVQAVLAGGEDYALLFTTAADAAEEVRRLCPQAQALGCMVPGQGVSLAHQGQEQEISFQGWQHLFS